uniref:t-SNARE coiled-coil homology domain-containing protein n=1 Tax=Amorphochlora amoebiformis TaxID=1561963 RepID=A0A6T6XGP1_9EUKA|mmetsp:Transcript_33176/g.53274  ORF Transcript_33176/g.53274 Transcript_33176/m.53274 type:complete len:135 (+) Transcript_33176:51-455(+)
MILGRSARNKKNDDPTPDEHIPLVRLDHSRFDPSQYLGSGPKADVVAARKEEVLDDMEAAVDRLGFIAHTIRSEVKEQDGMLDTLGDEVDDGSEGMGKVMKQITRLLGTPDRGRLYCILILIVVNVVLLIILTL